MKYYSKYLLSALLPVALMTSCADEDIAPFNVEKPADAATMAELQSYAPLKSYVNRASHPGFMLGAAIGVDDFLKQEQVYVTTVSNFDEVVAGNAMKYASCVADDGSMDFSKVRNFVSLASQSGLNVYGHTLCWHAQQNNKYLNSLLKDKEIPIDPNAANEVEDYVKDYSTDAPGSYPFYDMAGGKAAVNENGELEITNEEAGLANWQVQYFVGDQVPTVIGKDYKITVMIRGSEEGSLNCNVGDWGSQSSAIVPYTTEWTETTVTVKEVPATSSFVVFQSGTLVGKLWIKWVKVSHSEAPSIKVYTNLCSNSDCSSDDATNFKSTESTVGPKDASFTTLDGERCVVVRAGAMVANPWDSQFFVTVDHVFEEGEEFHFTMKYRADKPAKATTQAHAQPGGYLHWSLLGDINFTTEWQEFEKTVTVSAEQKGMSTIAMNLNEFAEANNYYFDDIKFETVKSGNTIPLTKEEMRDTLLYAMSNWIGGMMEATEGKVTAWDVVNEALSGDDKDGDGKYDLQSATRGTVSAEDAANNFYWQDYLGDDFVRDVVRIAREKGKENGAENLKLFVNDYNLESTWDDNQKVKSLVTWIQRWEADGVTKIDGIGSQMHISYNMNPAAQKSQEDHVVNMFKIIAASGKLCRVSELDMGLIDINGESVKAEDVTEEQHKLMGGFYQFIVEKYFELIPAAQQYGICQWCLTDAPADSGWRGGEPVGLWTLDFQRKFAYAGFAEGLANGSK